MAAVTVVRRAVMPDFTIRTEAPIDLGSLLAWGDITQAALTKHRRALDRALTDMVCFGSCEMPHIDLGAGEGEC